MIVVPAEAFAAVADALVNIADSGVPTPGLRVTVRDGEIQLASDTVTYGVFHWEVV